MPSLEALKRNIQSAEDLQSVVRMMKTLAAVSIRQYEMAVDSLGDYYRNIEDGLRMLLWQTVDLPHMPAPQGRTGAILFGSDQGMCGQFNEQVVNHALEVLNNSALNDASFLAVGARAAGRLEDAGFRIDDLMAVPGSAAGITPLVQELLFKIDAWRSERRLGRIVLFYNRRRTASSYRPHQAQLLPIEPDRLSRLRKRKWPSRSLPRLTMDADRLFTLLIRHYLFVSLFRACAESLAGENASRIASMQAAARNIDEKLTELRVEHNQLRQTAITEELLDVVTGFEALTQPPGSRES